MSAIRFAGQTVESWNPAIDPKSEETGRVRVIGGRNYLFDSKGPKSGFGRRLITGGKLGKQGDIQSIDVGGQTLIAAVDGLYRQEYATPALKDVLEPGTYWRKLVGFNVNEYMNVFNKHRWRGAYLNGSVFVTNRLRGLYEVNRTDATLHAVDGVPDDVLDIAVVAGRLVLLTPTGIFWSGPGNGNDFVPATAGAGFQLRSQYMADEPIGMTSTQQEIVIWGKSSAMEVQYVGGQSVFRFAPLEMELYPTGPMAIADYLEDTAFIMTRHGLGICQGTKLDMSITPQFNQFIRGFMNDNFQMEVRLDYIKEDDLLYVSIADSQPYYQEAFVLRVSIDKWGQFSEQNLGVCRFGAQRGATGYADVDGYLYKFTDTPDREVRGKGLIGLDSYIDVGFLNTPDMIMTADTNLEIQEINISSKLTFPIEQVDLYQIDWDGDGEYWNRWSIPWFFAYDVWTDSGFWQDIRNWSDGNYSTGEFVHEDWNQIDVNFNWSEDWNDVYDDGEELVIDDSLNNEGEALVIDDTGNDAGEEALPSSYEDWNETTFPSQDWNMSLLEASAEDWNAQFLDQSDDWIYPQLNVWQPEGLDYEDWNNPVTGPDEDWNGPYSFRNEISQKIQIFSSFDGTAFDQYFEPTLAIERGDRALYTTMTNGRFQFLRIKADDRWEYFHLTSFDTSNAYQGQYS